MNGFDTISALARGELPRPPMADTVPFTLLPPEMGRVELRATPGERFLNLGGVVHGGWALTMLDSAMGLAAATTLDEGGFAPTYETSVKFLRPIPANIGEMRVIGTVISRGRSLVALDGRIESLDNRIFAHGTSTCVVPR
ncbi:MULTISPECIES: PaaI family thioesterase [Sphingobium]|jgi:uncharacterized protein (TIGR00369 family)|uniref:Thioesterase domain-containing protein n=2 Tax=Sphingobium fuliginis (strain ATCC 27551) TaxID=336203 RepID=A0A292ZM15_SPHSA|nr:MULTISPECIES: PaaI family thioesterase [Sphingobium]MCB4862947.1 PaaI family thioesterase [Sphingobium sp. PNB]UXC93211.1 PaaI family thioesterase [Sphingobium sp. RSMS]GAY23890.1 hypothetical protein SFOMI_4468 [Sphingobium fuliginis]